MKKNHLFFLLLISFRILFSQVIPIPGFNGNQINTANSGTPAFNNVRAVGSQDLSWQVRSFTRNVGVPSGTSPSSTNGTWSNWTNAVVCGRVVSAWTGSGWTNADWISPNAVGTPNANINYYQYRITINMPSSDICGNAISNNFIFPMEFYADNCIQSVTINGTPQSFSINNNSQMRNSYNVICYGDFKTSASVNLSNGWIAGSNTIIVSVVDDAIATNGGHTGFLARFKPGSIIGNPLANINIGFDNQATIKNLEVCNKNGEQIQLWLSQKNNATIRGIKWQVSNDQGNKWSDVIGGISNNYNFINTLVEGEYWYRAVITQSGKFDDNNCLVMSEIIKLTVINCCEDPCSWSKSGNQNITPKNYIGPKNNADLNFKIEDKLRMRLTKNDANKIGHLTLNSGSSLMFGSLTESNTENRWGLEDFDEGLNFWKPSPSSFSGNYKVHIHDMGHVSIGNKSNPWVQKSTGWFGINKVQNFKLQVHGNAISDQWFQWSDEKIKTNVTANKDVIENISKLQSISYNYDIKKLNEHFDTDNKKVIEKSELDILLEKKRGLVKHFGFTAQNVEEVYPNLVDEIAGLKVVNYVGLIPVLTQAIKELNIKIEKQNNVVIENEELKAKILKLELKIVNQEQKFALIEKSISLLCESGCAGLEKANQNAVDSDVLYQSIPNPTDNEALINFYLSKKYNNASIQINSLAGKSIETIVLDGTQGKGSVKIQLGQYATQTYFYSLIVDNKVLDTKKLTVIR